MDPWSLVIAVAGLDYIPAAVILVAVLAQRPVSGAWMRRHARVFSWVAAIGWGATALRHWFYPGELPTLSLVGSIGLMICMAAYAVLQPIQAPDRR